ncbi:GOLPH3/VPS74 family protein [Dactylosporangium sp. CA-092794]|uniref:GOLPH3/VPS74 family protein n=1 Tax=Dactylosporangium sp. CA-092794 TaxID=3239929 RepID=UPI003D935AAB
MTEPLALRMPLTDSYYLIAHDFQVGRHRLDGRVLGIGLAAGLLGELVLAGAIDVHDRTVYVARRDPPRDPLLRELTALLVSQPQHRDLPTWLAYFAVTAQPWVVERLRRDRRLRPVDRRGWVRWRRVFVPADPNEAAWQAVRLERLLNTATPMRHADVFLAGIVAATGLLPHVLWDPKTNTAGLTYLPWAVDRLDASLLAIVTHADAAVGRAALAPR